MIVIALTLALVLLVVIIFFARFSKSKNPFVLGLCFAIIHIILLLYFSRFIYSGVVKSGDAESAMGWLIFYGVDFPVSLFMWRLAGLAKNNLAMSSFYIPFIYFAIAGTMQHFLIGTGIGFLVRKFSTRPKVKE